MCQQRNLGAGYSCRWWNKSLSNDFWPHSTSFIRIWLWNYLWLQLQIARQIYVRGFILQSIYGMGSVSKQITEGVCFVEETAIATGGMAQPAIASGGKGGEKGVLPVAVAIWPRRWREEGAASPSGDIAHVGLAHTAGETCFTGSPTRLARQPASRACQLRSRPQDWVPSSFSVLLHCLGMQQHCLGMQSSIRFSSIK